MIVASTGVIGQVLPIEPIADTAPLLAASLSGDGSSQAARAIMTTDTVVKEAAAELGMRENAASAALFRLRRALRTFLEQEGVAI